MCCDCDGPGLVSRREMLGGLVAAVALVGSRPVAGQAGQGGLAEAQSGERPYPAERPYMDVARKAERWLRRHAIDRGAESGVTWAADPADEKSVQDNLYSGSPGVVLFYLELARATGDRSARELAERGARYLQRQVSDGADRWSGENAGLYTGLAGIACVLERAHALTGADSYRVAARACIDRLATSARPVGAGVSWSDSNDIISGSAGIGLTLLWAARALGTADALNLAARAGRRLLETGIEARGGLTWPISPSVPRRYPNFSHGAAGVSYFLSSLYGVTKERPFLEAALKGAAYLQAVATDTPGGGKMVFHSEPGNEQLFYLSWCHGPSGTARLFHRLTEVTGDRKWQAYAGQLDVATRDMKVPERSPGFWNNISQCCGNCGVVEHFVAQYDRTGDTRHLAYARQVADDAITRATPDGDGLKWIQAEHRVRPELLVAQTGLMQGAAGVGLAMLHLDGVMNRRRPFVVLPDSPWFA